MPQEINPKLNLCGNLIVLTLLLQLALDHISHLGHKIVELNAHPCLPPHTKSPSTLSLTPPLWSVAFYCKPFETVNEVAGVSLT